VHIPAGVFDIIIAQRFGFVGWKQKTTYVICPLFECRLIKK
jgi:hypothetical protein